MTLFVTIVLAVALGILLAQNFKVALKVFGYVVVAGIFAAYLAVVSYHWMG